MLTLEQVYGALTFYLANQSEIDLYLKEAEAEFEAMRQAARKQAPCYDSGIVSTRNSSFPRGSIIFTAMRQGSPGWAREGQADQSAHRSTACLGGLPLAARYADGD